MATRLLILVNMCVAKQALGFNVIQKVRSQAWTRRFSQVTEDDTKTLTQSEALARMQGYTGGAVLQIKDAEVGVADNTLISSLNWDVMPGDRWAIIGENGCGKSTLLKALTGTKPELLMSGSIKVMGGVKLGYLEQTAVSGATSTVKEEVMSRMTSYQESLAELTLAEEGCTEGSECELARLEAATLAFEAAGGYTVEVRVSNVLRGLGFDPADHDAPCDSFSGGWQMRIALARLLLSEPELLVLDEPTNHLDASARRWLGDYVGEYEGTVVLVSHDEAMVRRAVNCIAEVRGGEVQHYKTMGYDKYLVEREERAARAMAEYAAMERERAKMQDFVDRMGAKASKATQAQDRLKKLQKLEEKMKLPAFVVEERGRGPKLTLAKPPSCGQYPVTLRAASFGYAEAPPGVFPRVVLGDAKEGALLADEVSTEEPTVVGAWDLSQCVVKGCDFTVEKGMRVVVRGPNGAGKSTLLKALSGSLPMCEGSRLEDERLKLGVFAQDLAQELPSHMRADEYVTSMVRAEDPLLTDLAARTVMGSLGLSNDKATRPIGSLSGGEKARVALATFCLTPHNVLMLDEPTNHLDTGAVASLLDALGRYDGAVLVVSHDRPFCEAVDATHVAYVAGGTVRLEERGLRESDWSEGDKGHRAPSARNQADGGDFAPPPPPEDWARWEIKQMASMPGDSVVTAAVPPGGGAEGSGEGAAVVARAAYVPAAKKAKARSPAFADSSEAMSAAMGVPVGEALGSAGSTPVHYSDKKQAVDAAKLELKEREAKKAREKSKGLNKKQAKAMYDEYEGIEELVEALELDAVRLAQDLATSKDRSPRPTFVEMQALASAASEARRVADAKTERWIELEDIVAAHEAA